MLEKTFIFLWLCLATAGLTTCTPDLKVPKPTAGNANFSRSIAIGGDYLAGYQDGALYRKAQTNSIPALLAVQFQLVGGSYFRQALMPDNNGLGLNPKPWQSRFIAPLHLGYRTDCKGLSALTVLSDTISRSAAAPYLTGISGNAIQNLAVPFATISQLLTPVLGKPGGPNPYYNRIAGQVGVSTVLSDSKNANATFFSAWLGVEDIYNYASNGGYLSTIPSATSFSNALDTILGGLTANGAKGILATIPDFRVFPFYTLIPYNGAILTKNQADSLTAYYVSIGFHNTIFSAGNNPYLISDPAATQGIRQLLNGEFLTLAIPSDSLKCNFMGLSTMMPDRYVLTQTEVALIDQSIAAYNAVIRQKASQYGLALADMNGYFNSIKSGIKWDGVNYNSQFLSGGFFSLDGYHPNQAGYALIANEFIRAINNTYKSSIPNVNCADCDGVLFP
jgi:hypothetical protein